MVDGGSAGAGDALGVVGQGIDTAVSAVVSITRDLGIPIAAFDGPITDVLQNIWEGFFGSPIPPGGYNWNAHSHEELFSMLKQDADVGEVSNLAGDWGNHGEALTRHAGEVDAQRGALPTNWTGEAAEPAAERLGQLGERVETVGTWAGTVRKATEHAGDALASAQNSMPPPPGDPTLAVLGGGAGGALAGAAIGTAIGAMGGGPVGAVIGGVAGAGASMFVAAVAAAEQKAEAVHVMQRYESTLGNIGQSVAPQSVQGARLSGVDGSTSASSAVPGGGSSSLYGGANGIGGSGGTADGSGNWSRLTGRGLPGSGAVAGRPGAMAAMGRPGGAAAGRMGAGRGGFGPGFFPPGALGGRDEDIEHRNKLPRGNDGIFAVDQAACVPVIGAED
ncbi:hypothetical protein EV193_101123 [Herbihabitans rhizosphaerae]|uniref:PPE family protein n=1 Tax=Herbihabitans rhizosphaerae TaxID=1872711 RepID=A0A4Q7L3Q6_9PSEU|nr:hypothetical protein [Herbihabitans rhizosphaerae]RZS44248.1 hypothetical protein EV193_101123 [Herbihabitans rhizosphaerae]